MDANQRTCKETYQQHDRVILPVCREREWDDCVLLLQKFSVINSYIFKRNSNTIFDIGSNDAPLLCTEGYL